ncbi:MAG: PAS domain-containing sensor histidine kinase [Actinomycetota bacterium]|nr:PAS domain-containing sensor histidine kinase [Actinomycetota bacterium]
MPVGQLYRTEGDADAALFGIALGGLGALLAAMAMVGVRGEVSNANVALVLVVFVLLGALVGGRLAGTFSAAVAAISFDFFHTQPYNSLKIASSDDLQTTLILLAIGIVVGEIGAWARRGREAMKQDRTEIWRIHRVAEAVARGDSVDDVTLSVAAEISAALTLSDCRFEPSRSGGSRASLQRDGRVVGAGHAYGRGGVELPPEGVELTVLGRGRQFGHLVLMPAPGVVLSLERRMIAVALADQLGQALSSEAPSG